jgi:hypothetical protein
MLLQVGRLSRGLALVAAHRQIRFKLCEFGVRELARKKAGIEAGERLVMELPVAATWPGRQGDGADRRHGSPSQRTTTISARCLKKARRQGPARPGTDRQARRGAGDDLPALQWRNVCLRMASRQAGRRMAASAGPACRARGAVLSAARLARTRPSPMPCGALST